MARAKKFGTFGGVFTPSILTILGVIMYLRLPYIVGQAGMWRTLAIVAVAHVISIATGLSVSSIATDKKVRAGGTYFMISRSLGLPIGGTLGLALFVGLSFSVSLYLIGFADSFLRYWNLPADIDTIRLTGSISLVVVTGVTLISTALALKTQYYIMAAIALSLLSILFGRHELAPSAAVTATAIQTVPFIVLFGIFFPAVTGFEAGVSMSGDLEDPKRSIPAGTIGAITVGLLAYIGLAIFLSKTVSPDQLANNPNVLLDIALVPPLVIAGIWGATISSAFGSILGAPRILQATSVDGITPRWFGIGYGRENEPRHALVIAFLIAEAGILIGQLDVIARVVSMFFITTYGFLNLTAAIESSVSPDFRPEFRVPRFIGLIGAAACFVVMIQLDFVAMIGASVLLGSVYFFLARRQLRLETGDTWEGVWSTAARAALHRLDRSQTHRRNWRPNVVAFELPGDATPLVALGQHLAGRRGMLSAFRFVESLSPQAPEPVAGTDDDAAEPYGVFGRDLASDDPFGEMRRIARYYGFAGIEPNTMLMAWDGDTRRAREFTDVLRSFADENHNILLLDYDVDRGWGERRRIDVWWRLTGNDIALSIGLIRFLTSSDEWREATIRFLTVNDHDTAFATAIVRAMNAVLDDQRVAAEVRVVNNAATGRSFVDIIRAESADSDLTILGMTDFGLADASVFVGDVNRIVEHLGSVLLVHASSFFSEPLVRLPTSLPAVQRADAEVTATAARPAYASFTGAFAGPAAQAAVLDETIRNGIAKVFDEFVIRSFSTSRYHLEAAADAAAGALEALDRDALDDAVLAATYDGIVGRLGDVIEAWRDEGVELQSALMAGAVDAFAALSTNVAARVPEQLTVELPPGALQPEPDEPLPVGLRKLVLRARARLASGAPRFVVAGRAIAAARLDALAHHSAAQTLSAFAADAHSLASDLARIQAIALDALERVALRFRESGATPGMAGVEAEALRSTVSDMLRAHEDAESGALEAALLHGREAAAGFALDTSDFATGRVARSSRRASAEAAAGIAGVRARAVLWTDAHRRLLAGTMLSPQLAGLRRAIEGIGERSRRDFHDELVGGLAARLSAIDNALELLFGPLDDDAASRLDALSHVPAEFPVEPLIERTRAAITAATAALPENVETATDVSLEPLAQGRIEDAEPLTLPVRRIIEYLAETEVTAVLRPELAGISRAAEESAAVAREVGRFIVFHLGRPRDEAGSGPADVRDLVGSARDRLAAEIDRLQELDEALGGMTARAFARLADRLDPYTVSHLSDRLQWFQRERRSREVLGGITRVGRRIARATNERAVDLLYRRSESLLFTRRLRRGVRTETGSLGGIRRLVESVSPRPAVLDRLPAHYVQLFTGRVAIAGDLRIGFDAELAEAALAIDLHRRGKPGGLLILSERGQGLGSLARLIAREKFGAGRFHRVDAPDQGSIDPDTFARRLGAAIGRSGPPDRIIAALPPGSAILISDLALWWERSPNGLAVLSEIADLIARFGDRVFFIAGANAHAFRLIRRLHPIEDQFLRVIECQPFSARQLRDVIMLRHQSTGLVFELGGRVEDDLSDWRLARLFTAIFDYSAGNVGWALNAWLAHITDVRDDVARIVSPRRPSLDPFDALGPVALMLLVQFAIHDRLDADRIARVTRLDGPTLARELRALEQTGLIVRDDRGVIRIDRFVLPHLTRFLTDREFL